MCTGERTATAQGASVACLVRESVEKRGKGPTGMMTQTALEAHLLAVETALTALA